MRSSLRLFDSRNQGATLISSSIQFRIALWAVDGSRGIDLHLRVLTLEINGFSEFSRSLGSSLAVFILYYIQSIRNFTFADFKLFIWNAMHQYKR